MGDDLPESPNVLMMDMEPGFLIPRHAHGCDRVEVIVRGTLYLDDEEFGVGDVLTAPANEFYGPKVAGPDGCMTAEFFSRQDTMAPIYELADGTRTPERPTPETVACRDWVDDRRARALGARPNAGD